MNWTKLAGRITRFLIYLFLLCPLLVIIITAFSDTNRVVFPPKGTAKRRVYRVITFEHTHCSCQCLHCLCSGNHDQFVVLEIGQPV